MLSAANFLILDEPTNHLDIISKEILENALLNYAGTVLYVSHDRYFINRTATRILDLSCGMLLNYIGNYDYYLEKKPEVETKYFGHALSDPVAATGSSDRLANHKQLYSGLSSAPSAAAGTQAGGQQKSAGISSVTKTPSILATDPKPLSTADGGQASTGRQDWLAKKELNHEKKQIAAQLEVLMEEWEVLAAGN